MNMIALWLFRAVDYLHHTGYLFGHVIPTLFSCISQTESSLTKHLNLSVTIRPRSGVVNAYHFLMHSPTAKTPSPIVRKDVEQNCITCNIENPQVN